MQSGGNQSKQQPPSRGLKQVKVDNWGTFFLQRLQQLYFEEELLDLTIKFPTSDITVQAHRLVITTCTDYFMHLERQQKEKDDNFDGVLIMPPDMPYECVKSIISFMYTGQLEYWTSEQNALYRTAQKMNMTVLTKLLDAQFNTSALQSSPTTPAKSNVQPIIVPQKQSSPTKKVTSGNHLGSLPSQPLPGRKLPIWKRKLDSHPSSNYEVGSYHSSSQRQPETTPGPSRFDLPEVDDFALGVFSSFDDITYNTKPIVQAPDRYVNSGGANSGGGNRSSLDSERSGKNDTTEDEDEEMHRSSLPDNSQSRGSDDKWENSDDEWAGPKPILRGQEVEATPSKRVRFELEEKENLEKVKNESSDDAINNHAKIIREVLKKYPHLVKNNKNIRLKIMQKESKSSEPSGAGKTKVSYVVLKSDHLMSNSLSGDGGGGGGGGKTATSTSVDGGETGPWKCNKCDLEEEYTNYYMYRRHMQDVHEEKFDPRVCEHCGYKATKRNILMYHLYTKHNVPPPKSMCFPKCHACSYVALSETLLVRHQINHNHRPQTRVQSSSADEVQCLTCSQTFKDVNELASHEINTGHGNATDGKDKGNRCPHCGKVFVRVTNLQVHLDCAHKDIREAEHRAELAAQHSSPAIALEPSSEAEALSHVVSGIAASLGVGCDAIAADHQDIVVASDNTFPICNTEIHLNNMDGAYNGHELVEGQQMIMLIDGEAYQQQQQHDQNEQQQQQQQHHVLEGQHVLQHQQLDEETAAAVAAAAHQHQPHQLEISGDEQIVMQGTEEGMIVYIHGGEAGQSDRQTYETYQTVEIGGQESEEIVEEVVEEVEEELVDESQINEEETVLMNEQQIIEHSNGEQHIEEVIQYVEEETEIVEYDESNSQSGGAASGVAMDDRQQQQQQESMMIIEEEEEEEEEEEHVEGEETMELHQEEDQQEQQQLEEQQEQQEQQKQQQQQANNVVQTEGRDLADEWDEDSADMTES